MVDTVPLVTELDEVARAKRGLLVGRAYYFIFFFGIINFASFINVHLQNLGISGTLIGIISAITFLISMFAPPLVGAIADRWQVHKAALVALTILTGVSALGFLGVSAFAGVLAMMIVISVFRLSIPGILDASIMALVQKANTTYGKQRLWGSIGVCVGSLVTGFLVARYGVPIIFWMQFVLMAIFGAAISLRLPVARTYEKVDYVGGLRRLLRVPAYRMVLVLGFCLGIAVNANVSFVALYMLSLGGAASLVGIAFTVGTLVEIPSMMTSDLWIARFGLRKSLIVSTLGVAMTWLIAAFAFNVWMIPLALALGGLFSGVQWSAMIPYTLKHTPEGLSATSLGISGAVFTGAGFAAGALLGGLLWDSLGGAAIYYACFAITLAGALIFAWGTRGETA